MSVVDFPVANESVVQSLPSVVTPLTPLAVNFSSQSMPVVSADIVTGHSSNGASHNMVVSNLSPTTIMVKGSSSKEYTTHLKNLGGSWNKGIQAWSFDVKYQQQVQDLLAAVAAGKVKPDPHMGFNAKKPYVRKTENVVISGGAPSTGTEGTGFTLPAIPESNGDFQKLEYASVFKPRVGTIAKIRCGNDTMVCPVTQVEVNRGKVDTAYIRNNTGSTSKLEVTNGHWQVRGLIPEHKIFFENK